MAPNTIFAPAKLNLFLAVTGRRPDGFHDLVSVVVPLDFGDTLSIQVPEVVAADQPPRLTCTDPEVPVDDTNLVLKAARAFTAATGWGAGAAFHLEKRIPMGAGLGGGSSNGAAALRLMNERAGRPLDGAALSALAATLGSDCPLFLHQAPVVMRGRGERIEGLPAQATSRLRGRRVLVFKPPFSIPTAWAYRQLAEEAAAVSSGGAAPVYLPESEAEQRVAGWVNDPTSMAESLLYNTLERPAFAKYLALPVLLGQLRDRFGLSPRMTGSGSACFAFLPDGASVSDVAAAVGDAWGKTAWVITTQVA